MTLPPFPTRLRLATLFLAVALPLSADAPPAFDHRAILAEAGRIDVTIDASAEEAAGREWPLHFTLQVPSAPGLMQVQGSTRQPGRYLSVVFRTPEGVVAERTDIIPAEVDPCPRETRRETVGAMITEDIVPRLGELADFTPRALIDSGIRDEMEAVEYLALYRNPEAGPIMLRIIAIFPPIGRNIVVGITHIALDRVQLQQFNELPGTLSYAMLDSIRFTNYRGARGNLVPMIGRGICED